VEIKECCVTSLFQKLAGARSCQGVWGGAHGNEVVLKENSACNGVECDTTRLVNGMSALGLQRVLGLGRYRSAWLMLHKLRRAMVRPHREKLKGVVEMDETYWGAAEAGVATGWLIFSKALIIIAAEVSGRGIGRIRMQKITSFDRKSLHNFIQESIEERGRFALIA